MEATAAAHALNRPLALEFLRLARPKQWAKSAFVFIGPLYAYADQKSTLSALAVPALIAATIFALCSSACYVLNDALDAEKDRLHPRKRLRPIASGAIGRSRASVFAAALVVAAAALLLLLTPAARWWVGVLALLYILNVTAYSLRLKGVVIIDVLSLSLGFVLRVLAGCGAVAVTVTPSSWLLNCTLFLAMFLAFGKRLGERRTMGAAGVDTANIRSVQATYTDELLRICVGVTGVATLVIYASYMQSRDAKVLESLERAGFFGGAWFNLLWLTMIPATYAMLRAILLLEKGWFDDPTELVVKDWQTSTAVLLFALITVLVVWVGAR